MAAPTVRVPTALFWPTRRSDRTRPTTSKGGPRERTTSRRPATTRRRSSSTAVTPAQRVQTTLHRYPWLSPAIVLAIERHRLQVASTRSSRHPTTSSVITQQVAVVGTLAIGQTLIILTAGIDLSCGAIMVFSSMVMAKTAFDQGIPGWLAILLGLVVGGLPARANGLLVTGSGCHRSSSRSGRSNIFTALTLLYATGRTIRDAELAERLNWLGRRRSTIGGVRVTTGVAGDDRSCTPSSPSCSATPPGARHVYAVGDDADVRPPRRHPGATGAAQRLRRGRDHLRDHRLDPHRPGQRGQPELRHRRQPRLHHRRGDRRHEPLRRPRHRDRQPDRRPDRRRRSATGCRSPGSTRTTRRWPSASSIILAVSVDQWIRRARA